MNGNTNVTNNNQTAVIPLGVVPDATALSCPKCGLTELTKDETTGHYICNTCQYEFKPIDDKYKNPPQINDNVSVDVSNLVTLKCSYCNTEVTLDKRYIGKIKCHWCRCTLNANNVVATTTVPRKLLTFATTRQDAKQEIDKYLKDRKIFALTDFKNRLTEENIMCTYFPYVTVSTSSHAKLSGQGEHTVKKNYDVHAGVTTYDADDYTVEREYDLYMDGLMIESYLPKKKKEQTDKISYIINNLKPFDIEKSIVYTPNYLGGCTSENRNINYEEIKKIAEIKSKNITKFAANETLEEYDRGVAWTSMNLDINKEDFKIIYLPIWLYGYKLQDDDTFYYIAVNGRTKKTIGNIPIDTKKLLVISLIAEVIGIILMLLMPNFDLKFIFLLLGIVCYFFIKQRYTKMFNITNSEDTEQNPKTYIYNLHTEDKVMRRKSSLKTTSMVGANNTDEIGTNTDVIYDERDKTSQSNKEFTRQK